MSFLFFKSIKESPFLLFFELLISRIAEMNTDHWRHGIGRALNSRFGYKWFGKPIPPFVLISRNLLVFMLFCITILLPYRYPDWRGNSFFLEKVKSSHRKVKSWLWLDFVTCRANLPLSKRDSPFYKKGRCSKAFFNLFLLSNFVYFL